MNRKFNSYEEFYQFYLREHSKPQTRLFHCLGTAIGLGFLTFAILQQNWALVFWGFLTGYAVAWLSHFFIEKNRPATIRYPIYSFLADFKMFFETLTGKLPLNKELQKY